MLTNGVASSLDRLFVAVNSPAPPDDLGLRVQIWQWDPSSGSIVTMIKEYDEAELLNNGLPSSPGGCFRARFLPTDAQGGGKLLLGCAPTLLVFDYDPVTKPDELTFVNYWKSDYEFELQDCRVYDMPFFNDGKLRVLAAKNSESFGVVELP